ncbi:acetylornithine and succinylornithine aminotransferase [Basidiobolus meristosporus CBS 931.73]|uniref:acetylornithine transaminase n=1 Tax=Basidiobolus meristosporus CBS 931.73 TaxID=1314790 RepID=A0A1Y1XTM7_9FUNG|nr:acetylornithine and succinylornithine aminotransferase [Basidiobolus meristosporus CBS 931.73]|eukprot:ORX89078.1 acetylornithine and succinylornithine aminotransferase [Basidiobolus meristosporus CBS 931.73]
MSRFLRKTFTTGSSLARLSQQIRYQSIASATHQSGPSKVTHPDADNNPKTLEILAESDKYILNTYSKPSLVFTHGKGCYLYDQSNRRYLDFCAGIAVNALGHADEEMTQVLAEQASQLVHLSNLFHHQWSGELAKALVESTKASSAFQASKVFLANSGTEANEGALKFMRKWGKIISDKDDKFEIVSCSNGFHGRSMGALSCTPNPKYQKPFLPLVPGVKHIDFNDVESIKANITEKTCGVIVEPVQGEGGIFPAKVEFLRAMRKRCDEVGALLVFDEIQCGLGRTGKLWAFENFPSDVVPDILTLAKPLANGFPIGAILMNDKVADKIKIGDHGTTFGGNPLGCRVALSVFNRISRPEFLANVNETGAHLKQGLRNITNGNPLVKEVRGLGLILGVEFTVDPTPIVKMARERGLIVITASNNTVRLVPPLILTKEEADQGLAILKDCFEEFKAQTPV